MITEDRIEELKRRGVKTDLLLSDWCLYCVHSKEIVRDGFMGLCRTGCNGSPPFNIVRTEYGLVFENVKGKTPLRYEEEKEGEVNGK